MKDKFTLFKKNIIRELKLLKSFDFNSLNFNEAGQWPLIIKFLVIVFILSIILFLGNNLHIKNLNKSIKATESEEKKLLENLTSLNYVNPTIIDYEQQLVILQNNLESIKQQLPEKIEMSSILDEMTQLAAESNVVVMSINLDNEVETENYIELPFKIKTKGKFHNFASFLSELSKMNRIVTVHDVVMIPSKDNSLLEMEFVAKTYKYQSNSNKKNKAK